MATVAQAIANDLGPDELVVALCVDLDRSPGMWWWAWFSEIYRDRVRPKLEKSKLNTAARLIEMLDQSI